MGVLYYIIILYNLHISFCTLANGESFFCWCPHPFRVRVLAAYSQFQSMFELCYGDLHLPMAALLVDLEPDILAVNGWSTPADIKFPSTLGLAVAVYN